MNQKHCKFCGRVIDADSKFCSHCGGNIESIEPPGLAPYKSDFRIDG